MEKKIEIPFFSAYPGRLRSFLLLGADVLSVICSIVASFWLYKIAGGQYSMWIVLRLWPILLIIIGLGLAGRVYLGNLLYPGLPMNPVEELRRQTLSVLAGFASFAALLTFSRTNYEFSRVALMMSMILCLILLPAFRAVLRWLLWKFDLERIPVFIMGPAELVGEIIHKMSHDKYCIVDVAGVFCEQDVDGVDNYADDKIFDLAKKLKVNYLIYCTGEDFPIHRLKDFMLKFHNVLIVENAQNYPVLRTHAISFYQHFSFEIGNALRRKLEKTEKRLLEVLFSTVSILMAVFPMIFFAILIKLTSKGPVFYRANRLGRKGKKIKVLKFRTMIENADEQLEELLSNNLELREEWDKFQKLDNDPRITKIGAFLRKTSLDELPQLLNVLKGDMALIGPRPIVEAEVPRYGEYYDIFASVKPGITGLWQVSGRCDVDYNERVALDVYYVNNWSFWMDYYIFWATIREVILQRGAK